MAEVITLRPHCQREERGSLDCEESTIAYMLVVMRVFALE